MSQAATAPLGHNSGDQFEQRFSELEARKAELVKFGDMWITAEDRKEIKDEETAAKLDAFIKQCKALEKQAEDARKAEKQPYLDAGRAVDDKFKALQEPVKKVLQTLTPRLMAYLKRKDDERREAERKAREEAERKAREAEEARRKAAESQTPTADEEALRQQEEEAARLAEEAEAFASQKTQVRSEFGNATSLRTKWVAEITDYDAALKHFANTDEVRSAVEKLANGLARSPAGRQTKVPGVNFQEEKVL